MNGFQLWATPWYINLLIVVPFLLYGWFRRSGLAISRQTLLTTALFGVAFGFVEASVVMYLRAALGMLPGYLGTLSDVIHAGSGYQPTLAVSNLPHSLFTVEFFREFATIVMLATCAFAATRGSRERFALFVWAFAYWDFFYYLWLWALTRWPGSLTTTDVLFLIPVPWIAQVWFPILICVLSVIAIVASSRARRQN